ncbi:MAG: DUF5020 family protein [Porphyromonadaceae bacterium]|nr:DUF5020 family protein [Porphyromonadaceae bacterium]
MRNAFFVFALLLCVTLSAQNFQVHYDFGKNRNYVTTTFEMFKLDDWGNTFLFVDFDYNFGNERHPSLAYMEIARCFTLGTSPLSAQIEYNGGLMTLPEVSGVAGIAIENAYLAGLDYGWSSEDFTKFLNFKVLYKYIQSRNPVSFQLTGVWTLNFFNDKLTLAGFVDFWREDCLNFYKPNGEELTEPKRTKFVLQSEPQVWYNISPHFAVGGEVETSHNFASVKGLKFCPTLGVKWTF